MSLPSLTTLPLLGEERRRAPRVPCEVPAHVRWREGAFSGHSHDVSMCGVLIEAPAALPPLGEYCSIELLLSSGTLEGTGRVARRDARRGLIALELTEITSDGDTLLAALLHYGSV